MAQRESCGLLILGASGFLGQHLVRAASATGVDSQASPRIGGSKLGKAGAGGSSIACVARQPPAHQADRRLTWHAADIRDEALMAELFRRLRPQACIQAAALSRMGDCEKDPGLARETNALAAEGLARLAARTGTRLVHISTDLVFGAGEAPAGGYREMDPTAALSVYGRSKALAEELVLSAYPGALVCRLPLLFGDSGFRGDPEVPAQGASDQILAAIAAGSRPRLFADEIRTPLDVSQAARALLELATTGESSATTLAGILHVAGPEALDRYHLGRLVLRARGHSPIEIDRALERSSRLECGQESLRPGNVALDSSRARGLLSSELSRPFDALGPP